MELQDLDRIRFVTRRFSDLQGLRRLVPAGLILLSGAGLTSFTSWPLLFLRALSFGGACLLLLGARRYYRSTFGEAEPPQAEPAFPDGVNVEFVAGRGPRHVAMRVHERGVGETRSCGTGACAVMVAAAVADGAAPGTTYRVDVPGGELDVTWTEHDRILLTGPAVIVAAGEAANPFAEGG